jgi:hypothetical protein
MEVLGANEIVQKMNEIGHRLQMNQRDIDLVQKLEAKEAARAIRARTRATVKYRPRKKREPS